MNQAHKRVLLLAYIAGVETNSLFRGWSDIPLAAKIGCIRHFLAWLKVNEDKKWGMIGGYEVNTTPVKIGVIEPLRPSYLLNTEYTKRDPYRNEILDPEITCTQLPPMIITRIPTHEPPLSRRLDDDRPWKHKRKI